MEVGELSAVAQQWLYTAEEDKSVTSQNMDSSVAFVCASGPVEKDSRDEMLIIPQFDHNRYVLGSVFGSLTPDIQASSAVKCRRFVVDLKTGDMYQTIWYENGNLCFVRHIVFDHREWVNEVSVLDGIPNTGGNQLVSTVSIRSVRDCTFCAAREIQCTCTSAMRLRSFGGYELRKECQSWSDWAQKFIYAATGSFTTHVGPSELWWSFECDMGTDYSTKMMRREYLFGSGRADLRLGGMNRFSNLNSAYDYADGNGVHRLTNGSRGASIYELEEEDEQEDDESMGEEYYEDAEEMGEQMQDVVENDWSQEIATSHNRWAADGTADNESSGPVEAVSFRVSRSFPQSDCRFEACLKSTQQDLNENSTRREERDMLDMVSLQAGNCVDESLTERDLEWRRNEQQVQNIFHKPGRKLFAQRGKGSSNAEFVDTSYITL